MKIPFEIGKFYWCKYSGYEYTQFKKYECVGIENPDNYATNLADDYSNVTIIDDRGLKSRWFGSMATPKFTNDINVMKKMYNDKLYELQLEQNKLHLEQTKINEKIVINRFELLQCKELYLQL